MTKLQKNILLNVALLFSMSFAVRGFAEENSRDFKLSIEKTVHVDCHLHPVVGGLPVKMCQTSRLLTILNRGASTLLADLFCKWSKNQPFGKPRQIEVPPQKLQPVNVVLAKLSADEHNRQSCFLAIGEKRFEIFKDYEVQWR